MSDSKRAVVDTNTFVSAVLNQSSTPARAVEKAFRSGPVLRSSATFAEVADVLSRNKFDRYQSQFLREQYMLFLMATLEPIQVSSVFRVCRHPKDDKFLELAVDGGADVIITGDSDLLVLHPFRGIAILSPADYLALS